jgi:basic amino acid/polyamine antiporter, APA family
MQGLFFGAFAKLTKKGVPAIGTIISGLFAMIFSFTLSLGELTDMISVGTLMAFTVVCAGVVILRHQSPSRPRDAPALMALFLVSCGFSSVSIIYQWPHWCSLLYVFPPIIIMFTFFIFPVADIPDGFKTPLVPIVPCVGAYINIYLIFSLDIWAIARVFAWTLLGLIIYFLYSVRNSKQGIYENLLSQSSKQASGSL